jgi:proliferating cell nuclear antigen
MIELKKLDQWVKSINAISSFISEGNFRFNDYGISFKAIDPSQIVLVNYSIPRASFVLFDVEPNLVGMDLVELNKIMQRVLPSDRLTMDLSDSDLAIILDGEINRAFRLPLIDVSEEEINIPSTKFDAVIEINARILKEALKDAALFGSSVVLRVKGTQLVIEARGSQGTLKTVAKQAKSVSVKSDSEVVSKYSLSFLSNIIKEADPDSRIKLELKTDAPMKVSYNIGDSNLQFHLAHMIL